MIRVNNVVKTFGDFRALDGVNLHVRDGAIYGLVGPNGAGKSTIIRHITGIYKPDAELEKFIYKKVESLVALKEYF